MALRPGVHGPRRRAGPRRQARGGGDPERRGPGPRTGSGVRREGVRRHRRALRPPGPLPRERARPGQRDPQRGRRQRLGHRGDPRAGAALQGPPGAPPRRRRPLHRRGARPARRPVVRPALARTDRPHRRDGELRHGGAAAERPAHRLRCGHGARVPRAHRQRERRAEAADQGGGRRLRPVRSQRLLREGDPGAPLLHRPARRLPPRHRRRREDRRGGRGARRRRGRASGARDRRPARAADAGASGRGADDGSGARRGATSTSAPSPTWRRATRPGSGSAACAREAPPTRAASPRETSSWASPDAR